MNIYIKEFAKTALDNYELSCLKIDKKIALDFLEKEIESEYTDLNKGSVKNSRFNHFKISNTSPESYVERLIELDGKRKVICGIRHKSSMASLPFVNIQTNFETSNSEVLDIYHKYLSKYFLVFSPLNIKKLSKNDSEIGEKGNICLVAESAIINQIPPWPDESEMIFINTKGRGYYDWYTKNYNKFHKLNPELKDKVPLNDFEIMEDSRNDGLLKFINYKGEKIGLIAAENLEFLGNEGLYFNEIFIVKEYRGRGLAKAIQRKFISVFFKEKKFVWGTVDYHNQSSYRTSLANNRAPVQFEYFIKI